MCEHRPIEPGCSIPECDPKGEGEAAVRGLVFGIYPGGPGISETLEVQGPPDDLDRVDDAIDRLCPPGTPFLVRSYTRYRGEGREEALTPSDPLRLVGEGRRLDFVVSFRCESYDPVDWAEFLRTVLRTYGPALGCLQVAEEPNNPNTASGGDGASPGVRQALIDGVTAAKAEARRLGLSTRIGFNACPSSADDFWNELKQRSTPAFLQSLDYVGLDFFPDVFRPIAFEAVPSAVAGLLAAFRKQNLAEAGIPPHVPIHICENGWATGPGRPPERQAEMLETIVGIVEANRQSLNIDCYEYFDLRDAETGPTQPFLEFGLLQDDYRPKPAFQAYRRQIEASGARSWPW
jgi:hypothetical protein